MIKAYLKLDTKIMNIGSCDDGADIYDYILDGGKQDDGLYLKLHQIPRIGESIFINNSAIELEILDIYHSVNLPFEWNLNSSSNHVVTLFCKVIPIKDWKRNH